jgi:hypothetical protein
VIGAGFITMIMALPATDIDGPVPLSNRLLWGCVGALLLLAGIVLFSAALWRLFRSIRRRPA